MTALLIGQAARKPFWYDEILTLNIARCRIGAEMWRAMTAGFEFNPPAIYIATHFSEELFGRGPVTSRLPSIIGGLVALWCTFRVASLRGGSAAGFWAILLIFVSDAFPYFYEARGYSLVLAGTAIAWQSWQHLVAGPYSRTRLPWLLSMSAGLTMALAAHMWAIAVPACFMLTALICRKRNKAVDATVLAAICLPGIVALTYAPIVAATRGVSFDNGVYRWPLSQAYLADIHALPLVLIGCALSFLAVLLFISSVSSDERELRNCLPREDAVLAACLVAAPAGIWVMTKLLGTAFLPRYTLVATLGLAFIFGQIIASGFRMARIEFQAIVFGLLFCSAAYVSGSGLTNHKDAKDPELAVIHSKGGEESIVYADGREFLKADYYAAPEEARRLIYVADRALAKRIVGSDGMDSALMLGRGYLRIRGQIVSYSDLEQFYPSFWFLGDCKRELNWISEKLRADRADIRVLAIPNTCIEHVTLAQGTSATQSLVAITPRPQDRK